MDRYRVLQKGYHCVGFKVSCRKLLLSELVLSLSLDKHCSRFLGGKKCLSKACVLLNVLLNQLIHRDIQHIVFNAEIGAGSVNRESLLMVNQDNSWLEHFLQNVDLSLLGCRVSF
jgi:hypothetical protein